jgi:hypothetical protein
MRQVGLMLPVELLAFLSEDVGREDLETLFDLSANLGEELFPLRYLLL